MTKRHKYRGQDSTANLPFLQGQDEEAHLSEQIHPLTVGATDGRDRHAYQEDSAGNYVLTDSISLTDPWWGLRYRSERCSGFIVGRSPPMVKVFDCVLRMAGCRRTALITGPTGAGKEVIAHALGATVQGPFVVADCAALPETLIDSELFGHVRGAFTGAFADRQGRFEAADNGTIFIDEIAVLTLALQAKLLRVIETRDYCRLGETTPRRTSAWVIAATNQSIEDAVQAGRFRHDLYGRLKVLRIVLPPLCDRQEDPLLLATYFVRKKNAEGGKQFTVIDREAAAWIREYPWPYNVRELKNAIDRAFVMGPGGLLRLEYLRDAEETVPVPLVQSLSQVPPSAPHKSAAKRRAKVTDQEMLLYLEQVGRPTTSHQIAPRWGVDVRTVERRLRSLVAQGLVLKTVRGKQHFYTPSNHSPTHPRAAAGIPLYPYTNKQADTRASTSAAPRLTLEPPATGGT